MSRKAFQVQVELDVQAVSSKLNFVTYFGSND